MRPKRPIMPLSTGDAVLQCERWPEARVRRRRFQRSLAPAGDAHPDSRSDGKLAPAVQMDPDPVTAFPRRAARHARSRADAIPGAGPVECRASRARCSRACRSSRRRPLSSRGLLRRRDRRHPDDARFSGACAHALELRVHARSQAVQYRHGQVGAPHPRERHQGHARGDDRGALPERRGHRVFCAGSSRSRRRPMPTSSAVSAR